MQKVIDELIEQYEKEIEKAYNRGKLTVQMKSLIFCIFAGFIWGARPRSTSKA